MLYGKTLDHVLELTVALSDASVVQFREIPRAEVPNGVLTLTMHPQITGRGYRMLMLERLIDYFASFDNLAFTTLGAAAAAFRA